MAQRPEGVVSKGLSSFSSPLAVRSITWLNLVTLFTIILLFIQTKKFSFNPSLSSSNGSDNKHINYKSILRSEKQLLGNNLLPRLRGGQDNNMFFVHPGSSRLINATMLPPFADFLEGFINVNPNNTEGLQEFVGKFPDVLNKLRTINLTENFHNGLNSAPLPKLRSHKKINPLSKPSVPSSNPQHKQRFSKKKSHLKRREKANPMEIYVRKPIPSDIYESIDSLLIRMDLPGVSKDNLSVECIRNKLVVTAKRRTAAQPPPGITRTTHHDEVQSGTYKRIFELPEAADTAKITAEFKDGELYLRMPKQNLQKARQIAIH